MSALISDLVSDDLVCKGRREGHSFAPQIKKPRQKWRGFPISYLLYRLGSAAGHLLRCHAGVERNDLHRRIRRLTAFAKEVVEIEGFMF